MGQRASTKNCEVIFELLHMARKGIRVPDGTIGFIMEEDLSFADGRIPALLAIDFLVSISVTDSLLDYLIFRSREE